MYPSMGNHERSGGTRYFYFDVPEGGGNYGEQWYSLNYSNAHLIFIDTNVDITPGSEQYDWLVNDLQSPAARDAEWVFVCQHHPGYNSWESYSDVLNYLVPLYEQYDVDVSLAGHLHFYERSYKHDVHYIVCGNAGGELYYPRFRNFYTQYTQSGHSFVTVNIDGYTAEIQGWLYNDEGIFEPFDPVVINHVPDCVTSSMHVDCIVCRTVSDPGQKEEYGRVKVSIFDNCGNPVSEARVKGTLTGDFNGQFVAKTDITGVATITTTTQVEAPSYTFCVDDVEYRALNYKESDNIETCDSY